MKKSFLFSASAVLLLTMGAVAAQQGGFTGTRNQTAPQAGGFSGPSQQAVVTVARAKGMRDDAKVILQGHIKQHKHGEIYVFEDATGRIDVDIDDEDWGGQQIGPDDRVEIRGEVDKGLRTLEIDVDSIRKI